ncbi:MAG: hypothetical protein ACK517_00080, partial [bacterium]
MRTVDENQANKNCFLRAGRQTTAPRRTDLQRGSQRRLFLRFFLRVNDEINAIFAGIPVYLKFGKSRYGKS